AARGRTRGSAALRPAPARARAARAGSRGPPSARGRSGRRLPATVRVAREGCALYGYQIGRGLWQSPRGAATRDRNVAAALTAGRGSQISTRMQTGTPAVTHISDTALWVAVLRARESRRPDAIFYDPFAERLAGERGRQIAERLSAPWQN